MYTKNEKIVPIHIEAEMKDSYINYAMSVIVGRALPDIRDGLKPVHRRILYAMRELSLEHNKPYKKSARIVGECLGKFHPHGDTAVYESLVRMVQDFSLRYPLVDGQGNFGCFTEDTEVKLADGRSLSFGRLIKEEKEGKKNYTYTYNAGKQCIELTLIKCPRLTKKNAELIEIKVDNGGKIRCTLNHRFMLRDGTYKEAKDLKPADSLMPLYQRPSTSADDPNISGYEMIYQPHTGEWVYTHRLADEWNLNHNVYPKSAGKIRHHIDFNKRNNNPDNVRRFPWGEHWRAHYTMTSEKHRKDPAYVKKLAEGRKNYWGTKGVKEKYSRSVKKLNEKNWKIPEYREKMIRAVKTKWNDPEFKKAMAELSSRRLKDLWKNPAYSQKQGKRKSEELKTKWKDKNYFIYMAEIMSKRSYEMWEDPYHREHISGLSRERWRNPEYRKKMSAKAREQWENSFYRKYMADHYRGKWRNDSVFREKAMSVLTENGKNAHKYRFLKVCEKVIKTGHEINSGTYEKQRVSYGSRQGEGIVKYEKGLQKYYGGDISKLYEILEQRGVLRQEGPERKVEILLNHKVLSVKKLNKRQDVYDLTIDTTHNFALACGVFVHNSIDGDNAAAMRYTEARMSHITDWLLADIDKETVDFTPNFDGSLEEPKILPATLPNLLVNGSSGIAVGMATNIPPHNLSEIVDAIELLIDTPDADIKEIMKKVKGPDFPTGGIISGKGGIQEAYTTGKGRLIVHAKANVEQQKNGKECIVITEIPYQVNKNNLVQSIAALINDKKIEGIADLRDESDKDGMRVIVELKRGQNAEVVLNQLYKHTQMRETFGVIMLALVDNRPRLLNLKEMLQLYIEHRKEIIARRTKFELKKAEERAHILEGLKTALNNLDKIIALIKKSKDPQAAKAGLMEKFKLSERQSQAILEMQLQRLTNLEREKIEKEYLELIKRIETLKGILESEKKVLAIIKDEATDLKKRFGDERRTGIVGEFKELEIEDLIAEEDMVITISHDNYIKRMPISAYKKQKRGGKGVSGGAVKEEDFIEHLFIASTHEYILFFTDKGRVYWLKVHEIPQVGRLAKGRAIINLLELSAGEKITSFVPVKEFKEDKFLFMATEQGVIKRIRLDAFKNPRKGGIIAISLNKDDELISTVMTDGKGEILLASKEGKAIRFREKDIRDMGRGAKGIRGMRLAKKDKLIAMQAVTLGGSLLTVTENGFGKRTDFKEYRLQSRGGKGIINIKITAKNGNVIGLKSVNDRDEIMIITQQGMVVRMPLKEIRTIGRSTQGVRVIKLKDKDRVSSIATIVAEEE